MKKLFIMLLVIISISFVNVVKAEVLNYDEQENTFRIQEGDFVCGVGSYYYGTFAYDYNEDNTINYVSRTSGAYYNKDYEPHRYGVDPESEIRVCAKIDKNTMYQDSPNGIPKTDTFIVFKETYYYGKMSIIPYKEPDVSISCDKNSLKYGETSVCTLSYKANYYLNIHGEVSGEYHLTYEEEVESAEADCFEKATFSFTNDNFKITKYESDYDVDENDGLFTLEANDDVTCEVGKDNVLLKFTVTPSSPEVAGASLNVSAENFISIDSFGTNKFNPTTNLGVELAKEKEEIKEKNPNTGSTVALYIVVIAFCVSVILFIIGAKRNVFKRL